MSRVVRRKTLVGGLIAVASVSALCYVGVTGLNVQNSKASFQKSGQSHVEVNAGDVNFTMTKLENVDESKALDTFDSTGVTVSAVPVGSTKTAGELLSYTETFNDVYPGWSKAYGFEVKNTGSLESFLDMYLGTAYISPTDATVDWDEQDPRARVKFTVYSGDTLGGNLAKVAEGHIQGTATVVDAITENEQYGNFQIPGKIPGTNDELAATDDTIYYVIKLEFEDNDEAWQGNNAGDNIYEDSKFKVNFAIGTAGPLTTGFEFKKTTAAEETP